MIPNHMTVINQPYDNSLDKLIERREEERFGDIELFYGRVIKTPLYLLGASHVPYKPRHRRMCMIS